MGFQPSTSEAKLTNEPRVAPRQKRNRMVNIAGVWVEVIYHIIADRASNRLGIIPYKA